MTPASVGRSAYKYRRDYARRGRTFPDVFVPVVKKHRRNRPDNGHRILLRLVESAVSDGRVDGPDPGRAPETHQDDAKPGRHATTRVQTGTRWLQGDFLRGERGNRSIDLRRSTRSIDEQRVTRKKNPKIKNRYRKSRVRV